MSSFIKSLRGSKYVTRSKSVFAVRELTDLDYAGAILKQKDKWLEAIKGLPSVNYGPKTKTDNLEHLGKAISAETERKLKIAKEYFKLEMKPPTSKDEMKQLMVDLVILREFVSKRAFQNLTVSQIWLLFLVGLEISMWFYLGETLGKMHIVGYKV